MFGLVLNAIVARRAQAAWLLVLTVLAVTSAAAAPWYLASAVDSVAAVDVAGATPKERVYVVGGTLQLITHDSSPLPAAKERVDELLKLPGTTVTVGEQVYGSAASGNLTSSLPLAHREGVCDQLVIDGACPQGAGQVILSTSVAAKLGVTKGQKVTLGSFRLKKPVRATVVGTYRPKQLLDPYWTNTDLLDNQGSRTAGRGPGTYDDAAFVDEATLLAGLPDTLDFTYQARLPNELFGRTDGFSLTDEFARAGHDLKVNNFHVITSADGLAILIDRDQNLVRIGVGVAVTQLLLLCWFALFLAVRHTAEERRPDIGLLKLRGAAPWRIWALTAEQSAWPMLTGAVLGWVGGYGAAQALAHLAGGSAVPGIGGQPLLLSLAAAGVAAFGALASAVIAEWRALGSSVNNLLRRVPARRSGWRADVIDLLVVALAFAGVYQGWAESGRTETTALPLLAPGLMALAIGLIVARLLPLLATRWGVASLRAGRPAAALATLHLARRPGTHRVLAMLVVAVCVLATAGLSWSAASGAWHDRAAQELGADTVLTVSATNAAQLLGATHRADPDGRYAMAVARGSGVSLGRVLAVDSERLARVALWTDEYGTSSRDALARVLAPSAPAPVTLTDGAYTLTATGASVGPVAAPKLDLEIAGQTSGKHVVTVGPITAGQHAYAFTVTGCPPAQPCRLAGLLVLGDIASGVSLSRLDGPSGVVAGPEVFGDVTRWRGGITKDGGGVEMQAADGRLTIVNGMPAGDQRRVDQHIYAADAPVPLPAVRAGSPPVSDPLGDNRISPLGVDEVPFRVAANADVLPAFGEEATIVDLAAALRTSTAATEVVTYEVWLTDDAPASVTRALTDAGLTIINTRTVDSLADRYARQGPAAALRYLVFTALVGLLLAAGSLFVVAAVERRPRAAELAALRAQGASDRVVRVAGYASYGVLVAGAVLAGLFAAVLARVIVTAAAPIFTDGWDVLPVETGVALVPLLLAAAGAVIVLAGATAVATAQMIRTVRVWQHGGRS